MARVLKPLLVGEVKHKKITGSVEVFYDRGREVFFGHVSDQEVTGATQQECQTKVREALEESIRLEWCRVIVVQKLEPFGWGERAGEVPPFVGFKLSRHEVARLQDGAGVFQRGRWVERDVSFHDRDGMWAVAIGETPAADLVTSNFSYPAPENREGKTLLSYSADLWNGLHALQQRVQTAHEQLEWMLGRDVSVLTRMLERAAGPVATGTMQLVMAPVDWQAVQDAEARRLNDEYVVENRLTKKE